MRTLGKTLSYTSGSIVANLVSLAFATYVQAYYTDVLKGNAKWIGIAATIQGVYAIAVYPFLGYLSDRTNSRWGRRVPFILYGAIPLGIAFAIVWMPPVPAARTVLFTGYFLITAILYDTLFNLTMVNWSALFPELFRTTRERARVSAWKQMFGTLGLIAGLGLTLLVTRMVGWKAMGITYGLIGTITLLTTIPSMQLKQRRASRRTQTDAETASSLSVRQAFRYTLINRSFVTFVSMRFFVQFAFVMLTADLYYYAKYDLLISTSQQSYLLLGTLLIALPLVYVWGWLVTRIGAYATTMTAIILFALALIPFFLTKSFMTTLLVGAGLGIGLSGILILTDILISDVIDEDELRTGTRREGMFYGIHGVIAGLSTPAQGAITTLILLSTGYTHTGAQPAAALTGFQMMVTVIPMTALLIGLIWFLFYPLRGSRVEAIRTNLEASRRLSSL